MTLLTVHQDHLTDCVIIVIVYSSRSRSVSGGSQYFGCCSSVAVRKKGTTNIQHTKDLVKFKLHKKLSQEIKSVVFQTCIDDI